MKPFNKRTLEGSFPRYLKRRGIDFDVTLHMLRHTCASDMLEDTELDKVAKHIGDSYAVTCDTYQSLTNKTKKALCENRRKKYNMLNG